MKALDLFEKHKYLSDRQYYNIDVPYLFLYKVYSRLINLTVGYMHFSNVEFAVCSPMYNC